MSSFAVPSARVAARLADAHDRRLTVAAAPAGFGKTTALASFDHDAWLELTAADRDVCLLANRVSAALGLPSAGARAPATGPDDGAAFAESRAAEICAELADHDDVTLVFDDAHVLGRGADSAAWRFLTTLVVQASAGMHVIVSSRRTPPGRVLSGSGSDAVQLGESEFALTTAEIALLLDDRRHRADGADGADLADAVLSVTGGWPAAVHLALALLDADGGEALIRSAGTGRWRTLARAMLDAQPPEIIRLLAATAVLGSIDEHLCTAANGATSLERVSELGLLVPDGRGGRLRLSPALEGLVPPIEDADEVRIRAAGLLEQAGDWHRALELYRHTGAGPLRDFLHAHGTALIDGYLSRQVCDALSAVGTQDDLDLEMLRGRALQAAGDLDRAAGVLHGVEQRADGRLPATLAWRYASLLYWRGEIPSARAALINAEPATTVADDALAAAWLGSCLWASGDAAGAQPWTERAITRAHESHDPTALAAAHTAHGLVAGALGDAATNAQEQRRALPWAIEADDRMQIARIRSNLAACAVNAGDFDQAAAELERAVLTAPGYTVLTGHVLSNQASMLLMLGRVDEGREASVQALELFARTAPTMSGATHLDLAHVDRERGDLVRSRLAAERALRLSEQIGDAHTTVFARAFLATLLAADDPVAARALAERALEQASEQERAIALCAAAWVELSDHRPRSALPFAEAAETVALETGEVAQLASSRLLVALTTDPPDVARLGDALARWQAVGNVVDALRCRLVIARCQADADEQRSVEAELSERGLAIEGGACALPLPGVTQHPQLRVVTLGTFQLLRGHDVVPVTEWKSRQARELMQLLIARRGQPLSREAIADVLWPDESGAQVANRLSVLLSTMRRVLDPQRAHEADYFVSAEDGAVGLRIERMSVDVIELFEGVRHGVQLINDGRRDAGEAVLRRAERLCRGEFLSENAYADWAVDCRSEALSAAQTVLRKLADVEAARGDDEAALDHLRRLLERDAYDEQAWMSLISALLRLRRHGEARRQHARYARLMAELDVAPIPIDAVGAAQEGTTRGSGPTR